MIQTLSKTRFLSEIDENTSLIENRRMKLILLVAPPSSGKTELLRILVEKEPEKFSYINLNKELSYILQNVPNKERPFIISESLNKIITSKNHIILLDNTEILFDLELRINPIQSLEQLSRNKVIIASWNGQLKDSFLTYAQPNHKEYYRCSSKDKMIIKLDEENLGRNLC